MPNVCERCGSTNVNNGAPHSEGDSHQVECRSCGHIKRVPLRRPDE